MAFDGLAEKLSAAFKKLKNKGKLSEADVKEAMREVRLALLEADVNYKVAKDFTAKVGERAVGNEVMESLTPAQQVIKIVNQELTELMGGEQSRLATSSKGPVIIMMCGLQGAGKTTHSGKLALYLKKKGHRPLLVACDIYRPAAIEQLKVVGQKAGVAVFELGQQKPLKIAKDAIKFAKDHGNDYVILDTAGRLHIDQTLMDELKDIKSHVMPQEILLVIDAMTGQDAVNAAYEFHQSLGLDGVIITKLDGDTRGGAALSVKSVTGTPIKFAGTGEKLDDLEEFHPARMASRILGMGDVLSLIERAQTQLDEKKANEMARKMSKNQMDLNDMLESMRQVRKMGPLKQVLSMLPGMEKQLKDVDIDDRQMLRVEAVITSMTKQERLSPDIINPSRKRRIAAGSGTSVEEVNRLLRQFDQTKKMMKQFSGKGKKRPGMMLPPGFGF